MEVEGDTLSRFIPLVEREGELQFQHPLVAITSSCIFDKFKMFVSGYDLFLLFANRVKFSRRLPDLAFHPPENPKLTLVGEIIQALTPLTGQVCDPTHKFAGGVFKASIRTGRTYCGITSEEFEAGLMRDCGESLAAYL